MENNTKALCLDLLAKHWLLNESFTNNPGLLNGKTGLAIFFFHYARQTGNKLYETFAGDLIDEILDEINIQTPINFKDGLCGIGWGIIYLIHHNFLEGNVDEILKDFDKLIFSYNIETCNDTSFETGSGGIEFYRSIRKGLLADNHPFELIITLGDVSLNLSVVFNR